MAAVPLPNHPLDELLAKAGELPVLPHVVFRLLEIEADENALQDIERTVLVDPGFALRLLRRANSVQRNPDSVLSLREAVRLVGVRGVLDLAGSTGASFESFVGKTDGASMRRRAWWRHSIDTGVCCSWLAERSGLLFPDEAYSCGLLHGIGRTLLNRYSCEMYDRVAALMSEGSSERAAESRIFGYDHVEVAIGAAQRWSMPEPLVQALDYASVPHEPGTNHLRACVALGIAIADQAIKGPTLAQSLPTWAYKELGFDDSCEHEIIESGATAISQAEIAKF